MSWGVDSRAARPDDGAVSRHRGLGRVVERVCHPPGEELRRYQIEVGRVVPRTAAIVTGELDGTRVVLDESGPSGSLSIGRFRPVRGAVETWSGPGVMRGLGLFTVPVRVTVSKRTVASCDLAMRPARTSHWHWGARRLRRYFAAMHEVATLLVEAAGASPGQWSPPRRRGPRPVEVLLEPSS